MRASARHLGLLSQGQKRLGQGEMQAPPPKRPFRPRQAEGTQHFYSPYSTEFQRGRGRGRGRGQRGQPTGGRGHGRGTTTAPPDPPQFWRPKGEYTDPIHTLSARTCRRSIDSFYPAVATDHHRFVGARDYWRWLCTRVCAKSTSIFGYSENESFKSDPVKHHAEGGQFSVGEKCCATSADRGGTRGLLQHNVFGAQKELHEMKTCDQSQALKQVHAEKVIQDGPPQNSSFTLKPQFWGVSIDLSDAYFHIPIRPSHWKFLRFAIAGQILEFKALPFGPTTAPKVFTKVVSAIVQFLRTNGVSVLTYLDDWLLYSPSHSKLLQARDYVLKVITWLGFIPNLEKSDLIPTQDFVFIGARFKLNQGLAAVPDDRFLKLSLAIQEVLSQKSTASAYQILRILGLMASVLQLVHWGRLHMRPIQLYLLHFWTPSKRQIQDQIPLNDHLFHHLKWWLNRQNVMTGVPLVNTVPEITLTTDASLLVQQLNDKFGPNYALYDKSMKLGTIKLDTIRVILKTGGILDLYRGGLGSHFPRWPPVSKIGKYVNIKKPRSIPDCWFCVCK